MKKKTRAKARLGRPKSEEKRALISNAAANLFLSEGFERTSMDTIASAAGVSKQTVYSHFRNKDDLFRSCISGKTREYALLLGVSEHDDLESGIRSLADGYLRLLSDPGVVRMWRLAINEATPRPRVAKMFHQTGPAATLDSLTAFLAHHADGLNTDDYGSAARTLLALIADLYQSEIMLGVISEIPAITRKNHVERVSRQFLTLFGRR